MVLEDAISALKPVLNEDITPQLTLTEREALLWLIEETKAFHKIRSVAEKLQDACKEFDNAIEASFRPKRT